ncbi:kinesin-like protein KIF14 isoform X3 [Lepisosteus oculatus]|uniref:kinesin-like protein KIF14 isoform X3 n=1 Tax=Lepisosteus oculatus TaxID=7918 RepID=UPI0037203D2F
MCDGFPSPPRGSKRPLVEIPPIQLRSLFDKVPAEVAMAQSSPDELSTPNLSSTDVKSYQSTLPFSPEKSQTFSINSPGSSTPVLQSTLVPQSPKESASCRVPLDVSTLSCEDAEAINVQDFSEAAECSSTSSQPPPQKKFKATVYFVVSKSTETEEENQGSPPKGDSSRQDIERPPLKCSALPPFAHVEPNEKEKGASTGVSGKGSAAGPPQKFPKSRLPVSARQRLSLPMAPLCKTVEGGWASPAVNEEKSARASFPDMAERRGEFGAPAKRCHAELAPVKSPVVPVEKGNTHLKTVTRTTVAEFLQGASCPLIAASRPLSGEGEEPGVGLTSTREEKSHDGEDSAVTVAIRVRPLNPRERQMNPRSVVSVSGQEAVVHHPHNQQKFSFCFDFAFWSSDGQGDSYAGQEVVYRKLAQPLLDKLFQGYNTCLFAYGQTGSGKSYTMMGYGDEIGIIPRFCEELFLKASQVHLREVACHIEMSYFEVYNEKIHDLLSSDKEQNKKKISLRVREHPELGPYVAGLSSYVVSSFADVQVWLELGNKRRATAATGMNDKSSRSHSVFTMLVTQTKREDVEGDTHDHTTRSRVNLVDLAGSERSTSAHTSGTRLKEGASINTSLMTLGKVISALSEAPLSKKKQFIPYRDSVLTWLLKESLGGNSKTAMIAALSPAALSVEETLSTLRYATQARKIINVARVNEDTGARIIRELKAEIEKLRAAGQCRQGLDVLNYEASLQEILALKEKLLEQEREFKKAQEEWKEKIALAEQSKIKEAQELKKSGVSFKADHRLPYLVNLNEDPQLSEMLLYVIKEGQTEVGRPTNGSTYDIQLTGALIAEHHCVLTNKQGIVTLTPAAEAKTYINGALRTKVVTLHHGDRVVLGGDHYFRFSQPMEAQSGYRVPADPGDCQEGLKDFEFAKNELLNAQKQRIEAEIEEARQQAQLDMMQELQTARELAQQELSAQRLLYENHIRELQREMEEDLNMKQEILMKEVEKKRKSLTLVTGPSTQELEECGLRHHKLMEALEQEKEKLAQEVARVQQARVSREEERRRARAQGQSRWGSLRLSVLLQEANTISKALNKQTIFTRCETVAHGDEVPSVNVRVTNSRLGISTVWNLQKFEARLVSMRELYQGNYEGSEDALFCDPSDTWDTEVRTQSPKSRRRSSLGKQLSEELMAKVFQDGPVVFAGSVTACKQLISCAMESLQKDWEVSTLADKVLSDLQAILESIEVIAKSCDHVHNKLSGTDLQKHCFTAATSTSSLVTTLQVGGACIPEFTGQNAVLDEVTVQIRSLGENLMLFLHGWESDIRSVVAETKDKIVQSSLSISKQLGKLAVPTSPGVGFPQAAKCGPQQAELLGNTLKEAFMQGADSSIEAQVDAAISELKDLQSRIQKLPSNKVSEKAKSILLSYFNSLGLIVDRTKVLWDEIQCLKNKTSESILVNMALYKSLSLELNGLTATGKNVFGMTVGCSKGEDGGPQTWEEIALAPLSAQTLLGTLQSVWAAVGDESGDPVVATRWATQNKEAAGAARELHSSTGELLKLLERQKGEADCADGGERSQRYKGQLPTTPGAEPGTPAWGRSGRSVREVIARLNCQSLTAESRRALT